MRPLSCRLLLKTSASARASKSQRTRRASHRSCSSCSSSRRRRHFPHALSRSFSPLRAAPVAQGGEVQLHSRSRRALTSAGDLLKLRLRAHGPRGSSSRSRAPRQPSGSSESVTRKALCFALCSRAPVRAAFSRSRRSSARALEPHADATTGAPAAPASSRFLFSPLRALCRAQGSEGAAEKALETNGDLLKLRASPCRLSLSPDNAEWTPLVKPNRHEMQCRGARRERGTATGRDGDDS